MLSALPPKADIETRSRNVRFVPKQTFCAAAKNFSSGREGPEGDYAAFAWRLAPGISTNIPRPPIGSIDLDPSDLPVTEARASSPT